MRIASEEAVRPCRHCYGSGECFSCSGKGVRAASDPGADCRSCGGSGRCTLCSGRGEVAYPTDQFLPGVRKPTTVVR